MSNYRKIHITLEEENFQAVRKLAFDNEVPISAAIDFVIEKMLRNDKETPPPLRNLGRFHHNPKSLIRKSVRPLS